MIIKVEEVVVEVVEVVVVAVVLGAATSVRVGKTRRGYRHGSRSRSLITSVGPATCARPQARLFHERGPPTGPERFGVRAPAHAPQTRGFQPRSDTRLAGIRLVSSVHMAAIRIRQTAAPRHMRPSKSEERDLLRGP
jgi:hypothetical protein